MTGRTRPFVSKLFKLGGAAILIGAAVAFVRSGAVETESTDNNPANAEPTQSGFPELLTYVVGYALALTLTIMAFGLVRWHWAPPSTALWIIFGLALVQMLVHFRCFLHVTLHGPARDDLQLILFSTLIVLLMVGGTLVVLFNLRMRMM